MAGVFSSLAHPATDEVPLPGSELFLGLLRRHGIIVRVDPDQDFALGGVFGIDRLVVPEILCRSGVGIQAQEILFSRVRAVTDEALIGEDRKNLASEVYRRGGCLLFSEDRSMEDE